MRTRTASVLLAFLVFATCSCTSRVGQQLRDAAIDGASGFIEQEVGDLLAQIFANNPSD